MSPDRLAEPTAVATGPLVETFAVNELVRQVSRFGDALGVTLYHYRTHGGTEIDVIAEADDGRLVAIEIKAAASARGQHFSQLAALRDRIDSLPDMEFVRGIVLYTGTRAHRFGDRLDAVPLGALWLPAR